MVFWGFGFGWVFFYFATRSALFSQAGLLEIPNLPAEGKAWDIQDEHCEKSRRVMQPGTAYRCARGLDALGGFKG